MIDFPIKKIEVNKRPHQANVYFYHDNDYTQVVINPKTGDVNVKLAGSIYRQIASNLDWVDINEFFENNFENLDISYISSGDKILKVVIKRMSEAVYVINQQIDKLCEHFTVEYSPQTQLLSLNEGRRRRNNTSNIK